MNRHTAIRQQHQGSQLLKRLIHLVIPLLLVLHSAPRGAAAEADVVVYGSTPGGFCAAIAAAREGASVILLEPTTSARCPPAA